MNILKMVVSNHIENKTIVIMIISISTSLLLMIKLDRNTYLEVKMDCPSVRLDNHLYSFQITLPKLKMILGMITFNYSEKVMKTKEDKTMKIMKIRRRKCLLVSLDKVTTMTIQKSQLLRLDFVKVVTPSLDNLIILELSYKKSKNYLDYQSCKIIPRL